MALRERASARSNPLLQRKACLNARPSPSGSGAGGEGARVMAAPQRHEGTKGSLVDGIARARQRPPHSPTTPGSVPQCLPLSQRERGWG